MNYPELCSRLIKETGFADVYYAKYPTLGTGATQRRARSILRFHDGVFDVGDVNEDRGTWGSDGQFATEEEACACMYDEITWVDPKPVRETPEEKCRSDEVMAEYHARQRRRGRLGMPRTGSGRVLIPKHRSNPSKMPHLTPSRVGAPPLTTFAPPIAAN